MKKTGEILKKTREEKGLSLHEVGLSLKISSKVLKAIEDGDDHNLPAKTFLRGFVQSYANFLHLNSEEVLKVFHEEMGSTKPKPYIRLTESEKPLAADELKPSENTEEATATASAIVTPIQKNPVSSKNDGLRSLHEKKNTKTIAVTVLGFALIGLIVFTKKMIDKYSKEAEVPTAEVEQTIKGATPVAAEPEPAHNPLSGLTGNTGETSLSAPASTVALTKGPTVITATNGTPTSVSTSTPTPSPAKTPNTKTEEAAASETTASVPTTPPTAAAKPPAKPEESNKPVELIVEALDTVEIEYSAPNGKPQKIRLSAEQVHTFKSRSGLKIGFSNGGAVNLIHNGKEIGIPGDLGKPIKLSY